MPCPIRLILPATSTRVPVHLRTLIDKFGITGALAAYNAGEGSVRRFEGMPPFPETHRYVNRIMDLVDANQSD